jgi:murein DD-endopeptidase MepM/ murein hydrolase activator NlpD
MEKLKFLWPVDDHAVTQGFMGNYVVGKHADGRNKHAYEVNGQRDMHRAIDIRKRLRSESRGSLIKCSYDGVVSRVSKNYGVIVKHVTPLGTFFSMYWHLLEPMVELGEKVLKGQLLGTMGGDPGDDIPDGGRTTGTHLHYRITKGDKYRREESIDPFDNPYVTMVTDLEDRGAGELVYGKESKEMVKWAKKTGIIQDWSKPSEPMSQERLGLVLYKFKEHFKL